MRRPHIYYDYNPPYRVKYVKPRGYGLSNLVGDLALTGLTFGLWVIWWIIREVSR